MTTNPVLFDSRNIFFKDPSGAVKADTDITFRILVSCELGPCRVQLVMQYDRHECPAVYEMRDEGAKATDDLSAYDGIAQAYDGFAQAYDEADLSQYRVYSTKVRIHDTGLYWYHFDILTDESTIRAGKGSYSRHAVTEDWSGDWQQTVYHRRYDAPEWIYGGIYYHVFVDRFNSSGRDRDCREGQFLRRDWGGIPKWLPEDGQVLNNDFFGGDLAGIRQKLPYLASLNVTCLYLSPIFEAYSNHKYDTGDYETIDPMFGTEEDFRALCRDAEEFGMRIICDGVFAHTGSDSRYFDRYGNYRDRGFSPAGAYLDEDSPYRNWYHFREDGTYDCWWDFETLPKLNKKEPSYIDYITGHEGVLRRWLRAGASGWRLDVVDELPCDFLDRLVAAAKAEKSDSIIIGEVWEDASNKIAYEERKNYFEGSRLDSVMNYPLRSAIIEFVRRGDAELLAETVESLAEHYPPHVLHSLMNLLGSHDSFRIITALAGEELGPEPSRKLQANTRLDAEQWKAGTDLLKKATLIQMTLPGVPCIYYGDEAGTEGYKDPFNRTCFPWGNENAEILRWYRKITTIRSEHSVYGQGEYATLAARDGFYAFSRFDEESSIITAVNCGGSAQALTLEGRYMDLLGKESCGDPPGAPAKGQSESEPAQGRAEPEANKIEGEVSIAPGEFCLLKRVSYLP